MSKIFCQITNCKKCSVIVISVKNIQLIHSRKKLVLVSKNKIKRKSRCSICLTERSFIDENEYDLESALEIYVQFFTDWQYKMKTYCLKCKKDTDNIDPKMFRTKNNRLLMQSKCSVCKNKKSRFVKEQEAKGLLSNLGIRAPLSKIPLLNVLF